MTEERRVQSSAALSAAFHALALGTYFLMKAGQQAQLVITNVEFVDMRPPAPAALDKAPGPLERAPRGVADFLKMALPSFKSQEPQEAPQEAQAARLLEQTAPSIKLDPARTLARADRPALARPDSPTASPSQLAARTDDASAAPAQLAAADVQPSLSLEEIGRKAVRGAGAPSIRIDPNAGAPRRAGLAEVAALPSSPSGAAPAAPMEAAIRLDAGGPARSAAPPSAPIGYGRGGGGSISLDGRPGQRGGGLAMPAPEALAPKPAESAPKTDLGSNKSVEISGPLAQRKVLSSALPSYPEWARAKNVEAEVVIRFFVSAEGRVRDRLILERTSGYPELDRLSMEAIKRWTFVPLSGAQEDQWGIITFRFRLR